MANSHKRSWYQRDWPYWLGAVCLALANTILLAGFNQTWKVTTTFAVWLGDIAKGVGLEAQNWPLFAAENLNTEVGVWSYTYFGTWLVIGMILGSFLSSTLSGQWRWRSMANNSMVLLAIIGGLLMGFGARLASGCNVGALASGIPSLSLHSYIFLIAILGGAAMGARILRRLFG